MKVDIEIVGEVLAEAADTAKIKHETRDEIMKEIRIAVEKAAAEAEELKEPREKKQYVILLAPSSEDEVSELPEIGWVAQVVESDSPALAYPKIVAAARAYNLSRSGRKHPVKSFGEACEVVPARFLSDAGVWVKTKLPVQLLALDTNELPELTTMD